MLEDATFEIECPNCNKKILIKSNQVGSSVICPYCKETIELKNQGFTDSIANAENQINNFLDDILK